MERTKLRLKAKYRRQFSYNLRLTLVIIVFVSSFLVTLYLATRSFEYKNSKQIDYHENQTSDYKVNLKPNDFYNESYLGKNMIYIASLIDSIDLVFNYNFDIEEAALIDFNYKIMADLIISSPNGTNNYFEKEYTLKDMTKTTLNNMKELNIQENISIDYDYYNSLANDFRSSFGVETNSYLKVYLTIEKVSQDNHLSNSDLNNQNELAVTIPLSEKAIEISFKSEDTSKVKGVGVDSQLIFNKEIFITEMVTLVIAIFSLTKLIHYLTLLMKEKSKYDQDLKKILKEYDRLIVETTTPINEKNSHIIEVQKFTELLDVRDNLQLPIMYFNVVSHHKCYFYIKNGKDVYIYKMKNSDYSQ